MRGRRGIVALLLLFIIFVAGAGHRKAPTTPPDYSRPESWAALPWVANASMRVPTPNLTDRQSSAGADVFYFYPTVFSGFSDSNADIKDEKYRRLVSRYLLTLQASSLNNTGRIFAPFYRQVSLWEYLDFGASRKRAFDLAYRDLRAAFLYYLDHYNNGRPLIILAHSQGSHMAERLLQEIYQTRRLDRILVVAYLVGRRIGAGDIAGLPPCRHPAQTRCFATWATITKGGRSYLLTGTARNGAPVCVNPLSWRMDGQAVRARRHLGGVPDSFDRLRPRLVSARCRAGLLEVTPAPRGFAHEGSDYHESDIHLFYANLRRNAARRLRAFLAGQN